MVFDARGLKVASIVPSDLASHSRSRLTFAATLHGLLSRGTRKTPASLEIHNGANYASEIGFQPEGLCRK